MRAGLMAVLLALTAMTAPARAYDFFLSAETIGQGYQLRAGDDTLVNRRRVTQYLGLDIFNLGPKDVYGNPLPRNQLYLTVSLRFDGELADYYDVPQLPGRTPQHEIGPDVLEILYAYLGGHDIGGFLDFKLGRQVMIDLFDWTSFDGLWLEARAPFNIAVEAWGGLNVTGEAPVDSPIYRTDGVALGGNPIGSLLQRQEDAYEPTFGVAAHTVGLPWLQARLSYARTVSSTNDRQPGEPGSGVLDEHVAFTARGKLWGNRLFPWVGLRYNLLVGELDEAQAGVRLQLGKRHGLSAEYVFSAPTFDGDSIWNVFGAQAFDDVRLTYDVLLGRLKLVGRGFVRLFGVDKTSFSSTDPATLALGPGQAWGASAGARLDLGRGFVRLDGFYEDGYGGLTVGADLAGRVRILGDPVSGLFAEGRLDYVYFRDDSRTIDHAHSLGIQAGACYSFARGITLHLLVEENVNRFSASQFRALALLDVAFWLGAQTEGVVRPRPWSGF